MPAELTHRLRALAADAGVTLFMTLLAAFQVLLHRYTGQDDVVVGTHDRRPHPRRARAADRLLRQHPGAAHRPRRRPHLPRAARPRPRTSPLGAYAHQDLPFEKLVEELQPERDLSRNPLFQVMFHLFDPVGARGDATASAAQPFGAARGTAMFDLAVNLFDTSGHVEGHVEFDADLFDIGTIEQLVAHYRTMLQSMVADADRRLSEVAAATAGERRLLLQEWNRTTVPFEEVAVTDLFAQQVARTPTATAFIADAEQLSYAALDARATQLAEHLRSAGIGPEVPVGVCLERSAGVPVALLAIFKAGGAYLPLDPAYPPPRLKAIVEDARAPVVVTVDRLAARLDGLSCRIIRLDAEEQPSRRPPTPTEPARIAPDDLAYIIYTSGSTGSPKGVAVEHRQILNRLHWMWSAYPFADGEVGCHKTPINFVDSLWELLGPLLRGVPSLIVSDETLRDPYALVDALECHDVTRLWLVPGLLRALLQTSPDLERRLPRLTFWVTSGEELPVDLARMFHERMPHSRLFNLYGTSEAWDVTWHECSPPFSGAHLPIGRPIANMRTYVLDPDLRPAPLGAVGELCVGGVGLARGYLNQPELTAKIFVDDPFARGDRRRLYRTGDLARYRRDGTLEYVGRRDHQVKLRGFRIEPGEVESRLREHPGIRDAVVVVRELAGDRRLLGYVVSDDDLDAAQLRAFVGDRLPQYMVPSGFVFLDRLPLTPSGKVNRLALPPPDAALGAAREHVAPRSPLEKVLVDIWEDVLGIERVGVKDDFFGELGGHSLLGTQVVARIREALNVDLPLRRLFEAPSVGELAAGLLADAATARAIESTAEIVLQVMEMPDDEVEEMLADRARGERAT